MDMCFALHTLQLHTSIYIEFIPTKGNSVLGVRDNGSLRARLFYIHDCYHNGIVIRKWSLYFHFHQGEYGSELGCKFQAL